MFWKNPISDKILEGTLGKPKESLINRNSSVFVNVLMKKFVNDFLEEFPKKPLVGRNLWKKILRESLWMNI